MTEKKPNSIEVNYDNPCFPGMLRDKMIKELK